MKAQKLLKWGEHAQNETCLCTATTGITCKLLFFPPFFPPPTGVCEECFIYSYNRALFFHLFYSSVFSTSAITRPPFPNVCVCQVSRVTKCMTPNSTFFKRLFVALTHALNLRVWSLCQLYLFDNQWIIPREHHVNIKQGLLWVIYKSTQYWEIY